MAKYSTGDIGGDSGGSCELCGAESSDLRTANVAGATLEVCSDCAQHDEDSGPGRDRSDSGDGERDRTRNAVQNAATLSDARRGDPEHWEQGADYEDDPLPYLVRDYGERLEEARQEAGLRTDELAAELEAEETDVVAVEQGRATRAGVGGSLVEALEERLNVRLAERTD